MKLKTTVGLTSQIWQIIIDDSSSTTGAGLSSLLYNSAGLAAKYKKKGDATWTTITLQTITTIGTYESDGGGFRESDSGAGGGYEFQPPDAVFSTVGVVWIELYGAANMAPVRIEIEVDRIDYANAAWDKLMGSADQIIPATVDTVTNTHTPTATEFQADDITESEPDHFVPSLVIFTSGDLAGQRRLVTAYSQVGGIGQFTTEAFSKAPANNDTFLVI